jgi:hypothetical protein
MVMRIITSIDQRLQRPLGELAIAERRTVREQAGLLLERAILDQHARLREDPERAMRLPSQHEAVSA